MIPAHAGFTGPQRDRAPGAGDHPRSRGVYLKQIARDVEKTGSSPLARGLQQRGASAGQPSRIIPARAGFTSWGTYPSATTWDHPRSRGVYWGDPKGVRGPTGSSPLARGLHDRHVGELGANRIIPARAGFTSCPAPWAAYQQDHPRSRGVYRVGQQVPTVGFGSSPLARGLRRLHRNPHQGSGIIPARAGFTPGDS